MSFVVVAACSSEPPPDDLEGPQYDDGRPIFQGTPSEHQLAVFECLADAGFDITVMPDPSGRGYAFTQHDDASFQEVREQMEECRWDVGWPWPWEETEENRRVQYEQRLEHYDCLIEAGYDINDPPSFASYFANARDHSVSWDPYGDLGVHPPERALEVCPRSDTWFTW